MQDIAYDEREGGMKLATQWMLAVTMLAAIGWMAVESFQAITSSHGRLIIHYLGDPKFRAMIWKDSASTITLVVFCVAVFMLWIVIPLARAWLRSRR